MKPNASDGTTITQNVSNADITDGKLAEEPSQLMAVV